MLDVLAILAGLSLLYAIATWFVPDLLRPLWWLLLKLQYSFRVFHADRVPKDGAALIVCNHASYLDWLVLWVAVPRRVKFLLWSGYYEKPLLRVALSWMRHRTLRIDNRNAMPHSTQAALDAVTAALDAGEAVVIFPEGRLTRNGQMRPFGRGLEAILKATRSPVAVIPACTSGLWGSVFSHRGGRIMLKLPECLRRRVCVWFGQPLSRTTSAPEVRAAVVEAMADLAIKESDRELLVPRWYVRTSCKWRNMFRPGLVDVATGTEKVLTIGQGLVAAWCLRDWLSTTLSPRLCGGRGAGVRGVGPEQDKNTASQTVSGSPGSTPLTLPPPPEAGGEGVGAVGIWLPTGLGSTLANVALGLLKVPTVNLNYTAGPDAVVSACEQAGLKTIITAKRFLAKMPLEPPAGIRVIHLEDALAAITKRAKLIRFLAVLLLPAWLLERLLGVHDTKPDDLLTIIFSSGSTGAPKGVMLTMRNVSANGHSFEVGVDLRRSDTMLATLPFFHSFGYTVCLWAPVGVGMKAVFYPDPRSAKEIGELCTRHRCTIMLGTATFLRFYLRRCEPTDFQSVRLLICGAEKLPVKLQDEFEAKFHHRPLEGYGCTELSPVASTNLHDVHIRGVRQVANRHGTVGQPIPGVAAKAFHPETHEPLPPGEEGLLGVKGPNVMLGYLHQPEKTAAAIKNGWYLTGDCGLVEPDGFIRITGRLSRFAKIAGEMVPLEKVEEDLLDLIALQDRTVAVAAVPDEKRGERVVVLYLKEAEPKLDDALKGLAAKGLPNLWVPDRRDCYEVESFPTLGSGKLDLRAVSELALKCISTK